jgi:hypothetical protein
MAGTRISWLWIGLSGMFLVNAILKDRFSGRAEKFYQLSIYQLLQKANDH